MSALRILIDLLEQVDNALTKPKIKEYSITGIEMYEQLKGIGVEVPMGIADGIYYYTDLEGWNKIMWALTLSPTLYKTDRFDCDDYAKKVAVLCREKFGLNSLGEAWGNTPAGFHGFNILFHGDGFHLHEPNLGFGHDLIFPIGGNGYVPQKVFI